MQVSQHSCQLAVHLLRVRRPLVPGTEPRLDMPDLNPLQKSSVAGQKSRQRIAVDKHNIRLRITQNLL
ncbi:hypothetical protein D3C77_728640 [compost metagenome]